MATASEGEVMIRRILITVVALLTACLGLLTVQPIVGAVPAHVQHTYAFDRPHTTGADAGTHQERGPPESNIRPVTYNAADRGSNDTSARPTDSKTVSTYDYDATGRLVQCDSVTATSIEPARTVNRDHRLLGRGGVAAKTGALTERAIGTTMDDVLQGASFYKQSKATQYLKPGGFSKANADFDALAQGVTVIERGGGLRTATLSNGTNINVRPFSSGKYVTLEVATPGNPVLKIRYEP